MKRKTVEIWDFQVGYRHQDSREGSVDGCFADKAKSRDDFFEKANETIGKVRAEKLIPVDVLLFHKIQHTTQQSISEFNNSYSSVQGCKPKS